MAAWSDRRRRLSPRHLAPRRLKGAILGSRAGHDLYRHRGEPLEQPIAAVLGIEVGTASLTALAADLGTGHPVAVSSVPLPAPVGERGVREQEPQWWWDAAVTAVRSFEGLVDVRALAVAGPPGLVCTGPDGEALGPATLGTSSPRWCASLADALGGREAVRRAVGTELHREHPVCQLARLREVDPDRYRATSVFCLPHDHFTGRLVGGPVTDEGDASVTGYFDVRHRRWSEEVLDAVEPGGRLGDRLPPVAPPGVAVGELSSSAAGALFLRPGTAVVNGTGTSMATALGMGLFAPGRLGVSLRTRGAAFVYSATVAIDPLGEVDPLCDATGGWLPQVSTVNCLRALQSVSVLLRTDLRGLSDAAAAVGPGADGLVFLPYLEAESTPPLPEGSGALWGAGPGNVSAPHVARAAFDGVTLALAHGFDALHRTGAAPASLVVGGPGAASALWRQTLADVAGMAVRRVPTDEPAAWGAAALAAWALTDEPVASIVRRWWAAAGPGAVAVSEPDPAAHEIYAAERRRRCELIERVFRGTVASAAAATPDAGAVPDG